MTSISRRSRKGGSESSSESTQLLLWRLSFVVVAAVATAGRAVIVLVLFVLFPLFYSQTASCTMHLVHQHDDVTLPSSPLLVGIKSNNNGACSFFLCRSSFLLGMMLLLHGRTYTYTLDAVAQVLFLSFSLVSKTGQTLERNAPLVLSEKDIPNFKKIKSVHLATGSYKHYLRLF